jgi:hypothetical protein
MRLRKDEPNRSSHAHSHAGNGCTGLVCGRAQDVSFAKEKGGKTRYRMMPSHWKQWRIAWRGKKKSRVHGGERDRQLQQLWAKTKIGDILPWEDVEREAEKLLESTRTNARNSGNSGASQEKNKMMTEQ